MSIRRRLKKLKIERHHLRQQLAAIHDTYNKIYNKRADILDRTLEGTTANLEEDVKIAQLTDQLSVQNDIWDKCDTQIRQINEDIDVLSARLTHQEVASDPNKKTEKT